MMPIRKETSLELTVRLHSLSHGQGLGLISSQQVLLGNSKLESSCHMTVLGNCVCPPLLVNKNTWIFLPGWPKFIMLLHHPPWPETLTTLKSWNVLVKHMKLTYIALLMFNSIFPTNFLNSKRERMKSVPFVPSVDSLPRYPQWPEQIKARNCELNPGSPHGWQKPSHGSQHHYLGGPLLACSGKGESYQGILPWHFSMGHRHLNH